MNFSPWKHLHALNYWARTTLFYDWKGVLLTVVTAAVAIAILSWIINFVFVDADWGLVSVNLNLFFTGSFPEGQEWRLVVGLYMLVALIALSFGIWAKSIRRYLAVVIVAAIIILVLGFQWVPDWLNGFSFGFAVGDRLPEVCYNPNVDFRQQVSICENAAGVAESWQAEWLVTLGAFLILVFGAVGSHYGLRGWRTNPIVRSLVIAGWVLVVPATLILTVIGEAVSFADVKAFFLDIMIFLVGGFFSLPLGILLALGRFSSYRVISYVTTTYIEIVRAGPLLVWLFFARFVWQDFFPPPLDSLDITVRVMIVFSLFGAAYIAEVIRGGLQSLDKGQYEAAQSLGLSTTRTTLIIVLPQAIRAVLPAIIGRMISIWKDTALVLFIGLTNTLQIQRVVQNGQRAIVAGNLLEIALAVILLYWIISFTMSRLGSRVEKNLSAGQAR